MQTLALVIIGLFVIGLLPGMRTRRVQGGYGTIVVDWYNPGPYVALIREALLVVLIIKVLA